MSRAISTLLLAAPLFAAPAAPDPARIRKGVPVGFSNAGWKYDRYADLESLDKRSRMTVADLKGPGIIRHIHFTKHHRPELSARGVVLEITFDDAKEPAVMCPLGDFFGDGCNGRSMEFTSNWIEVAPKSYNTYFPMPFRTRARVVLRNDTDRDLMDYSYVEWEPLAAWEPDLGYFHATFRRDIFQLTKETKHTFFEVRGSGHVFGRQWSVATREPMFTSFNVVMEGNNEIDIDGRERAIDYLGTEDSFGFSWGFQATFAGLRCGMTHIDAGPGKPQLLSIYRFHDPMPIRFDDRLTWSVNWREEKFFVRNPEWPRAVERGGCWVDYATVFFWYQDVPGGFEHAALAPVSERCRAIAGRAADPPDLQETIEALPVDPVASIDFAKKEDLDRVRITGTYPETHPFWIDEPQPKGGHPGQPNPGRRGILAVHAESAETPCLILRRITVPEGKVKGLRITLSGDPYEAPGKSDFAFQLGILDGGEILWFPEIVVDAGSPPDAENWRSIRYPLAGFEGKTIGIIVKVAYGGSTPAMNEEAFIDEIAVVDP
ncbi:MAG: DUF2961 domain-containing protein [Planctomycetes bacterium]|nr:DUF2961 domain-containing protein [Planctomycetota bacterium]